MGFYLGILIKSSPPKGGVHKLQILLREQLEDFLRNFFGEEMGGVRGTQPPNNILDSLVGPLKGLVGGLYAHIEVLVFFSFYSHPRSTEPGTSRRP